MLQEHGLGGPPAHVINKFGDEAMFDAANVDGVVHLAFSVSGYEFPDAADDWCFVRVAVRQGSESFEAVDAALEATELPRIADWFRCWPPTGCRVTRR